MATAVVGAVRAADQVAKFLRRYIRSSAEEAAAGEVRREGGVAAPVASVVAGQVRSNAGGAEARGKGGGVVDGAAGR